MVRTTTTTTITTTIGLLRRRRHRLVLLDHHLLLLLRLTLIRLPRTMLPYALERNYPPTNTPRVVDEALLLTLVLLELLACDLVSE